MKFKSKFFRVATEGATTDGRRIERKWIEEMAETFDPQKYGARVWLEHIRGIFPDSDFKAYGDVLALEAREVEDGKLALFAQISPTDELIEINKSRQKIYTSIEMREKFADTNKAYLIGLGITDSPASLGTEILAFSSSVGLFESRKQDTANLYSEAIEAVLDFEETDESANRQSFSALVKNLFSIHRTKADKQQAEDFQEAINPVVEGIVSLEHRIDEFTEQLQKNDAAYAALKTQLNGLQDKLARQEDTSDERPISTGDTGLLTDC